MRIRYAGNTHVGMKRDHNEDSLFLLPEHNIYIVADGMGGHASGEVASQMAVETIVQFYKDTSEDEDITWPFKMEKGRKYQENRIIAGVKLANLKIYEAAMANSKQKGMGTTVVATVFHDKSIYVGHVGDSRVYRLRGGQLTRMTRDHSLYNEMMDSGYTDLPPEDEFPHGNVITRALGMDDARAIPEVSRDTPLVGDIYLLCTDGLLEALSERRIAELMRLPDHQQACDLLVQEAYTNGGRDNITAVIVHIEPG